MNLRRSVRLQLDDGNGSPIAFEVPETVRSTLPQGTAFEQRHWQAMPWLHGQPL